MSRQSKETAARNREMLVAKAKYREDFRTEHDYIFCEGCGLTEGNDYIDISHNVGIAKDLSIACDPENFALMCRNVCHRKVEARDLEGLHNEEKVRGFIEEHDPASLHLKALNREIKTLLKDLAA